MRINTFEYNKIKNIIIDYVDEEDTRSFTSGVYLESYKNMLNNIYKLVEKLKEEEGVELRQFIEKYENRIFKDRDFVEKCGFMDCILYWYDENKAVLAGYPFEGSDDEEYFIKYNYGYHNYDMGTRYILQSFNSLDEYFKEVSERYIRGYLDNYLGLFLDENFQIIKKYGNNYISYTNLYYVSESNKKMTYEKIVDTIDEDFIKKDIQYDIKEGILQINIGKEEIDNFPDNYLQEAKKDIDVNVSIKNIIFNVEL